MSATESRRLSVSKIRDGLNDARDTSDLLKFSNCLLLSVRCVMILKVIKWKPIHILKRVSFYDGTFFNM